jgi:hypothetical protein
VIRVEVFSIYNQSLRIECEFPATLAGRRKAIAYAAGFNRTAAMSESLETAVVIITDCEIEKEFEEHACLESAQG